MDEQGISTLFVNQVALHLLHGNRKLVYLADKAYPTVQTVGYLQHMLSVYTVHQTSIIV